MDKVGKIWIRKKLQKLGKNRSEKIEKKNFEKNLKNNWKKWVRKNPQKIDLEIVFFQVNYFHTPSVPIFKP